MAPIELAHKDPCDESKHPESHPCHAWREKVHVHAQSNCKKNRVSKDSTRTYAAILRPLVKHLEFIGLFLEIA
jgi:hypothetical protein